MASSGSSPRGRGKPSKSQLSPRPRRLIPARAGKTARPRPPTSQARAHPRAGGENDALSGASSSWKGSSPRGRGKRDHAAAPARHDRLIPARAGKTLSDLRFYRADRSDLGNP